MTDTPWTPGPWERSHSQSAEIVAPGVSIAHVRLGVDDPPKFEANARLIAAAPEMAELLAFYIEDEDVSIEEARAAHRHGQRLLARIRGESE